MADPPPPTPRPVGYALGTELQLEVERPGAGGACVARDPASGRVVFVRHALPGELVRVVVTEDRGGSYLRADAVEIDRAAPQRVNPPCPHAGPGRCGGCDWQHATPQLQRLLKADVIRDQFARIARIELGDLFTGVEELPGGPLGWRTRIGYAVGPDGRPGLRRHASHQLEHVASCPLGVPGVGDAAVLDRRWPGFAELEVIDAGSGAVSVVGYRVAGRERRRGRTAGTVRELVSGPERIRREVDGHRLTHSAGGFWQVHPGLADIVAEALRAALALRPGEHVLDLYAGAGALTATLAAQVGPAGRVTGVEGDAGAVRDAVGNLADQPWAQVRHARVEPSVLQRLATPPVDVVVLDPPRAGAGVAALGAVLALAPRVVGYLSCDAGTLARDVAEAVRLGWRLRELRAFDAFPMTQHVECLAVLEPSAQAAPEPVRSAAAPDGP